MARPCHRSTNPATGCACSVRARRGRSPAAVQQRAAGSPPPRSTRVLRYRHEVERHPELGGHGGQQLVVADDQPGCRRAARPTGAGPAGRTGSAPRARRRWRPSEASARSRMRPVEVQPAAQVVHRAAESVARPPARDLEPDALEEHAGARRRRAGPLPGCSRRARTACRPHPPRGPGRSGALMSSVSDVVPAAGPVAAAGRTSGSSGSAAYRSAAVEQGHRCAESWARTTSR